MTIVTQNPHSVEAYVKRLEAHLARQREEFRKDPEAAGRWLDSLMEDVRRIQAGESLPRPADASGTGAAPDATTR